MLITGFTGFVLGGINLAALLSFLGGKTFLFYSTTYICQMLVDFK